MNCAMASTSAEDQQHDTAPTGVRYDPPPNDGNGDGSVEVMLKFGTGSALRIVRLRRIPVARPLPLIVRRAVVNQLARVHRSLGVVREHLLDRGEEAAESSPAGAARSVRQRGVQVDRRRRRQWMSWRSFQRARRIRSFPLAALLVELAGEAPPPVLQTRARAGSARTSCSCDSWIS